ncbi:LysR family transcriptional regulator [Phenylobacterium aquaticum]|uniref:LysR family transcriptional regulator n=1 Tax=Phenylobacterium aquaticum TaxID=1763816 RepID=UPI001F5CB1EF|nr:LysR family transcriptional regulator [Phenylobacterium aquaticum]
MLNELSVFVKAVELKSISAAARNLRLSAAAASHRILQLEEQMGIRLLNRTTRSLQPTEAGLIFYEHALDVLAAVERAENSMATASGVPTGTLRVTAPLGFGRRFLAPLVSEFHALYPRLEIRLRLSDHVIDLLSESVDVAVRMAVLPDSSLVVRKIADCPRVLCASPAYLEQHGRPETPDDLLQHNCLLLRYPGSAQARWTLETPAGPTVVPVAGRFDADDGDVLTEWALQGAGIVLKPYWEVADHLRRGELEALMPAFPPEAVSLTLLYPNKHLLPARVRLFADFLVERTRLLIERPAAAAVAAVA